MAYYFAKSTGYTFEEAVEKAVAALAKEGFGILTEIDVQATLKKKIDVDFRKYKILGACNPRFAHEALEVEDKIGVFLPCSVIVQELGNGITEIAVMNPMEAMQAAGNAALEPLGKAAAEKLERALAAM